MKPLMVEVIRSAFLFNLYAYVAETIFPGRRGDTIFTIVLIIYFFAATHGFLLLGRIDVLRF